MVGLVLPRRHLVPGSLKSSESPKPSSAHVEPPEVTRLQGWNPGLGTLAGSVLSSHPSSLANLLLPSEVAAQGPDMSHSLQKEEEGSLLWTLRGPPEAF